jgi:hypothetical protein
MFISAVVVDPVDVPFVSLLVVDPDIVDPDVVDPDVVDPVVGASLVVVPLELASVTATVTLAASVEPLMPVVPPEPDEPVTSAPGEKQPATRHGPTSLATPRMKGIPWSKAVIDRITATIPQGPQVGLRTAFSAVFHRAPTAAELPPPAPVQTPFPCAEPRPLV